MSKRRVSLVLLCEDGEHESIARRFLEQLGFDDRKLRRNVAPPSKGSGEQYVREQAVHEAERYRIRARQGGRCGLIVMIDADGKGPEATQQRKKSIEDAIQRKSEDAIAIVVPSRNIETWIYHLQGNSVDEEINYKAKIGELDRGAVTRAAAELWRRHLNGEETECPASLRDTATELYRLPEINPPAPPRPMRS